MTVKEFKYAKLALVIILAVLVSQALVIKNFALAAVSIAVCIGLMFILRRRVKGVLADERDHEIAGRAAWIAMTISSYTICLLVLVFMFMRDRQPEFGLIGSALAYAVCAQMLIYSLVFGYLHSSASAGRRKAYLVSIIILTALALLMGLRLLSGEDSWICEDGKWIEHGHPSQSMPTEPCE